MSREGVISKEKLLECLRKELAFCAKEKFGKRNGDRFYLGRETALSDVVSKIESGSFDLPTDTDEEVEGLTWEDLCQIRIKLRDDERVLVSEIYALVNAVGTLWSRLTEQESKYTETLAQVERLEKHIEQIERKGYV